MLSHLLCFISRSICNEAVPSKKNCTEGFMVWVIADSENGYFLDVDVYVSRPSDGDNTERGLGECVVLQLTEQFHNKNYRVFFDNFFSSPALFSELLAHNLYACGTVRCDRLNLQIGEHQFQQRLSGRTNVRWVLCRHSLIPRSVSLWGARRRMAPIQT